MIHRIRLNDSTLSRQPPSSWIIEKVDAKLSFISRIQPEMLIRLIVSIEPLNNCRVIKSADRSTKVACAASMYWILNCRDGR